MSYLETVESDIPIDIADQVHRAGFVPSEAILSPLALREINWGAQKVDRTFDRTTRAVLRDLTVGVFLDEPKFTSVERNAAPEPSIDEACSERSRQVIAQLQIEPDTIVLGGIEGDIIATRLSEVVRNAGDLIGAFYENDVL